MTPEEWRPVVGFEDLYEVSDQGRVRSLDRVIVRGGFPARYRGRVLRQAHLASGYRSVVLSDHGVQKSFLVHDLVLSSFVGPCPPGRVHRCHNDGDKANNHLVNLRYDTVAGNASDRARHGTLLHSDGHPNARLTRADVAEIRRRYRSSLKADLAAEFGVNENHIYRIAARKRWAHV
jgi:hypothetical protein